MPCAVTPGQHLRIHGEETIPTRGAVLQDNSFREGVETIPRNKRIILLIVQCQKIWLVHCTNQDALVPCFQQHQGTFPTGGYHKQKKNQHQGKNCLHLTPPVRLLGSNPI